MDDVKLDLKACAHADDSIRQDAKLLVDNPRVHFEERVRRAAHAGYVAGFRAGELEGNARRSETEAS